MNPTSESAPSFLRSIVRFLEVSVERVGILTVVGVLAASLAGFAGHHNWLIDLFNHMRMHLMVASFALVLVMIWRRNHRWFWIAAGCCLLNVVVVQPWKVWVSHDRQTISNPITLLSWNILWANQSKSKTAEKIIEYGADVVALIEYTDDFSTQLDQLKRTHPHFIELPTSHAFGMAVFSRIPCQFKVYQLASGNIPVVKLTIQEAEYPAEIWVAHVYPPMGTMWDFRGRQMEELIALLKADGGESLILCGDLNDTPWSRTFRRLVDQVQLRDARIGLGYQSSWPKRLGGFGIPIDHVLVSPTIGVSKCKTEFQKVDSDHAAVFTEFGILQ